MLVVLRASFPLPSHPIKQRNLVKEDSYNVLTMYRSREPARFKASAHVESTSLFNVSCQGISHSMDYQIYSLLGSDLLDLYH